MPLLTYLALSHGYQKRTFYNIWVAITLSIEYIATETIHISFMWYTASTYSCVEYFCLLLHMKLCCVLGAAIKEDFLISSVRYPWHCLELYMQYNLCIMDTFGPFICKLIIRVSMIIQVSLQIHAKAHFGTMTNCVDYAGVLIFKCLD